VGWLQDHSTVVRPSFWASALNSQPSGSAFIDRLDESGFRAR
jgi:hypothetical protein